MKKTDLRKLYLERVQHYTALAEDWQSRARESTTEHRRGVCLGKARDYRRQAQSYTKRLERLGEEQNG